jgi:hypothetical protein
VQSCAISAREDGADSTPETAETSVFLTIGRMKVMYCCNADKASLDQYYANQAGGYMPVYAGARMQRGHGLGSIFSAIGRFALPILR